MDKNLGIYKILSEAHKLALRKPKKKKENG